ncbi:CPBP family intramembrane glutamic endopeptidase [Candidatus Poriferisocius sp.]|uniref:CPBP family intramembrane glutamic endopeptidase n=1 Tax=Candidatus Poriferisocius sp. TaxID=3101276 RepID=UPI003B5C0C8C
MKAISERVRAVGPAPGELDRHAVALILLAIGVVIAIRYGGLSTTTHWLTATMDGLALDGLSDRFDRALHQSEHAVFNRRLYWGLFRWVVYVVPAVLVARFLLRTPLRDLGLRAGSGLRRHAPIYLGLYLVLLPFVVAAAFNGEFQNTYPFYEPPPGVGYWPRFYGWQAVYAGQFLALEFFFRGVLVHGLARRFGAMAVFVALIPYVMIHLTKPLAEALGSIVAGTVLGFLSLRTGSVYLGAALHFAVALTIDVLVLTVAS